MTDSESALRGDFTTGDANVYGACTQKAQAPFAFDLTGVALTRTEGP